MEPVVLLVAFLCGAAFRQIGFPPLMGYLMAGFVASAVGLGDQESLQVVADIGITLLLFTIGLKLRVDELKPVYVWGSAVGHIIVVVPLTAAFIFALGALYEPLAFDNAFTAWTLAFALSFSSTVLSIKVFEERGDSTSFYATIAIGVLVVQDVFAVVWLVLASGHYPSPWAALLVLLPLTVRYAKWFYKMVGHGELLLFGGVVAALLSAAMFELVGLKGGLGALVFGAWLGAGDRSRSKELSSQLLGLKNLLLIGFFVQIGYYGWPEPALLAVAAIIAALIALRPLVYFALFTRLKLRARTGWLAALSLSSYSEFGLIIAAAAVADGLLNPEWVTTLALAMTLSFFIATPINNRAHQWYRRHQPQLTRHESNDRLPEEVIGSLGRGRVAVLGMGRIGLAAYRTLEANGIGPMVGIEENWSRHLRLQKQNVNTVHGDASDMDFWDRTGLVKLDHLLVCLSNHRENLDVVELARELGFKGDITVIARFPDESDELRELGCEPYYLYEGLGDDLARHAIDTSFGTPVDPTSETTSDLSPKTSSN